MICDKCHEDKDSTAWRLDPYEEDVNSREVKVFICDECEKILAYEI